MNKIINFFNLNSGAVQAISTIVLVTITAYYAWQTKRTVREIEKQTNLQQMPILKISKYPEFKGTFTFSNIGKGAALNIELRVSQIHHTGGLTNLRSFEEDELRAFYNLGTSEDKTVSASSDIFVNYQSGETKEFSYGEKLVFAVIATYEDIYRNRYYTLSLFRVKPDKSDYILKTTKTGTYESGEIEKVISLDWLR